MLARTRAALGQMGFPCTSANLGLPSLRARWLLTWSSCRYRSRWLLTALAMSRASRLSAHCSVNDGKTK